MVEEKFYQINSKRNPNVNGYLIKINDRFAPWIVAGEGRIEGFKIKLNGLEIKSINENYSYQKLNSDEARKIMLDWKNYIKETVGKNPHVEDIKPWRNS